MPIINANDLGKYFAQCDALSVCLEDHGLLLLHQALAQYLLKLAVFLKFVIIVR